MATRRAGGGIAAAAAMAVVVGAGALATAAPARSTLVEATPAPTTSVATADDAEAAKERAEQAQDDVEEAQERAAEQAQERAEDAQEGADDEADEAPALTELRGTVERRGRGLFVGDVELGLGPRWYREQGEWAGLLQGLVGQEVTFLVEREAGEAAVFAVNGTAYRPEQGRPPWAGGPKRQGIDPSTDKASRTDGGVSPGQAKKGATWTPPGRAKKAGGTVPPGQSKRPPD